MCLFTVREEGLCKFAMFFSFIPQRCCSRQCCSSLAHLLLWLWRRSEGRSPYGRAASHLPLTFHHKIILMCSCRKGKRKRGKRKGSKKGKHKQGGMRMEYGCAGYQKLLNLSQGKQNSTSCTSTCTHFPVIHPGTIEGFRKFYIGKYWPKVEIRVCRYEQHLFTKHEFVMTDLWKEHKTQRHDNLKFKWKWNFFFFFKKTNCTCVCVFCCTTKHFID